jgi:hypothetical protein
MTKRPQLLQQQILQQTPYRFRKGDRVACKAMPHGPIGIVFRSSEEWVDVRWSALMKLSAHREFDIWTKRMKPETLQLAEPQ